MNHITKQNNKEALDSIMRQAEQLLCHKDQVIIAIDGRCAAGKTTTAGFLAEQLNGEVIHMDDFFLPLELRTKQRYQEPGGNVHYERFKEEVVSQLSFPHSFSYQVFDCKNMNYSGYQLIQGKKFLLVEGAYCMHPQFVGNYDITVFMHVDKDEQKRRIIERNGQEMYSVFENRWIKLEEDYITHYHINERCEWMIEL